MDNLTRHPSTPRKTPPPPRRPEPEGPQPAFCTTCHALRPVEWTLAGTQPIALCRGCGRADCIPPDSPRAKETLGDGWQEAMDRASRESRRIALTPAPKPEPTERVMRIVAVGLLLLFLAGMGGTLLWLFLNDV